MKKLLLVGLATALSVTGLQGVSQAGTSDRACAKTLLLDMPLYSQSWSRGQGGQRISVDMMSASRSQWMVDWGSAVKVDWISTFSERTEYDTILDVGEVGPWSAAAGRPEVSVPTTHLRVCGEFVKPVVVKPVVVKPVVTKPKPKVTKPVRLRVKVCAAKYKYKVVKYKKGPKKGKVKKRYIVGKTWVCKYVYK